MDKSGRYFFFRVENFFLESKIFFSESRIFFMESQGNRKGPKLAYVQPCPTPMASVSPWQKQGAATRRLDQSDRDFFSSREFYNHEIIAAFSLVLANVQDLSHFLRELLNHIRDKIAASFQVSAEFRSVPSRERNS